MGSQTQSNCWWLAYVAIAAVAVTLLGVFFRQWRSTTPARVTIVMTSNGTARLGGVPLLTTNIRDATFATMGALGIKAGLSVPTPPTNMAQQSNLLETLQSMSRAGLLTTNKPPNPYE